MGQMLLPGLTGEELRPEGRELGVGPKGQVAPGRHLGG